MRDQLLTLNRIKLKQLVVYFVYASRKEMPYVGEDDEISYRPSLA